MNTLPTLFQPFVVGAVGGSVARLQKYGAASPRP
jgi:hypothetical protein